MDKQWYQSKTFWFNVITMLIGIIQVISKSYPISPELLALIVGVGNLILRSLSGEPIVFGSKTLYKGK
jgi:hypothetical protein